MRLIDADKLKSLMIEVLLHIKENPKMDGEERHVIAGMHMLGEMIDDAPTIEAVPVRHGKWIYRDTDGKCRPWWEKYTCSVCGENTYNTNYCPHCGAKMDEEES